MTRKKRYSSLCIIFGVKVLLFACINCSQITREIITHVWSETPLRKRSKRNVTIENIDIIDKNKNKRKVFFYNAYSYLRQAA